MVDHDSVIVQNLAHMGLGLDLVNVRLTIQIITFIVKFSSSNIQRNHHDHDCSC